MINLPRTRIRFVIQMIGSGVVAFYLLVWAIDSAKLLVYFAGFVALISSIRGLVGVIKPGNGHK